MNISTKRLYLYLLIFLGFVFLYTLPRIILFKSPSFIDEFIYTRWAQQGFFDPSQRLISLVDGKQPFFIWLISLTMSIYPNPLIAGKIVSFVAGFGTMIGVGTISYLLFKRFSLVVLSMLFYALCPFAVVYDHLAIYDGIVGFFYMWSIVLSILFIRKPTLGSALIFANLLGAALLTKSTTIIFYFLIPLTFLFEQIKKYQKMFPKTLLYTVLIIFFSFLYQSILYLSPNAAFVSTRNSEFVRPFAAIISLQGISESLQNIWTLTVWIFQYLSFPICLLAILPFFIRKLRNKEIIFILLTFLIPFCIFCFMGTNIFPRHIFFFVMPLLILAAYTTVWIFTFLKKNVYKVIAVGLLLAQVIFIDFSLYHNLPTAPIPAIETFQLANGWPSGYGVKQIVQFLIAQSARQHITIAAEGAYGSLPLTASQLYFSQFPSVTITDFDLPLSKTVPPQIVESAKSGPVYLFFNITQKLPDWPMKKVLEIQKGVGNNYMRLYQYQSATEN